MIWLIFLSIFIISELHLRVSFYRFSSKQLVLINFIGNNTLCIHYLAFFLWIIIIISYSIITLRTCTLVFIRFIIIIIWFHIFFSFTRTYYIFIRLLSWAITISLWIRTISSQISFTFITMSIIIWIIYNVLNLISYIYLLDPIFWIILKTLVWNFNLNSILYSPYFYSFIITAWNKHIRFI